MMTGLEIAQAAGVPAVSWWRCCSQTPPVSPVSLMDAKNTLASGPGSMNNTTDLTGYLTLNEPHVSLTPPPHHQWIHCGDVPSDSCVSWNIPFFWVFIPTRGPSSSESGCEVESRTHKPITLICSSYITTYKIRSDA